MEPDISALPAERQRVSAGDDYKIDEKKPSVVESKDHIIEGEIIENRLARNIKTEDNDPDTIIVTGADAAAYLLPMRDDFDSALTFRGVVLASCMACFQAVMYQIYMVRLVK